MKIFQKIIFWLFSLCLPILLLTGTIAWEVNLLSFYEYGFDKYDISQATGLDNQQLRTVAQRLIDYFDLRADSTQVEVSRGGAKVDLFNERELIHLEDVKNLIQRDYWVARATFLLLIVLAVALIFGFNNGWREPVRGLFWGSVITIGLMIAMGVWAIVGFDQFFLLFHLVSFSNQFWMLDPAHDYLIRLFPEGFFYDAAMLGYGVVMLSALVIGGLSCGIPKLVDSKLQRH